MAKPSVTVDETTLLGVRFIRWGLGLFIFGLIFGFGLLGYYFHGTVESAMIAESGGSGSNTRGRLQSIFCKSVALAW